MSTMSSRSAGKWIPSQLKDAALNHVPILNDGKLLETNPYNFSFWSIDFQTLKFKKKKFIVSSAGNRDSCESSREWDVSSAYWNNLCSWLSSKLPFIFL